MTMITTQNAVKSFFTYSSALLGRVLLCVSLAGSGLHAVAENEVPLEFSYVTQKKVSDVFAPLPAGSVCLDGFFSNDIDKCVRNWQKDAVPYAKLVDFFRNGRPQFALGEMWGKAVRSGSMFYRYRHDEELKEILRTTVDDLLTTTRSNGSISCAPVEQQPENLGGDMWERKYVLLGLSRYYLHVEASPRILEAMERQAQSIMDQVGDAPKVPITLLGWSANKIESSSLLEPFMRLYFLTGKQAYLDFATYIVNAGGCHAANIFDQAYEGVWPRAMATVYPKAYEMLSIFEGLAEYYRATGNERWLTCLQNMYRNVRDREITILGNGGADQPYFPNWAGEAWSDTKFEQTNPLQKRMMETCIGVTWMKFCSQLLRLTGDPGIVDMIEKYIYNGLLGAMRPGGDGFSYVNLLNGEKVTNYGWGWKFDGKDVTCCNLNGPMGLAYIPFISTMQSEDGPVVNLYNAATVKAKTAKGQDVELKIDTRFPLSSSVEIAVNPAKSERFTLRLRIPAWSKDTRVEVNGKPIKNPTPGTYLALKRKWNAGDRITMQFDMRGTLVDAPHGTNPAGDYFKAVTYGPIVLTRDENTDAAYDQPVDVTASENGEVALRPVSPTLSATRMEFIVPTSKGDIRMIDYASANGWSGKKVCTWLPMLTK